MVKSAVVWLLLASSVYGVAGQGDDADQGRDDSSRFHNREVLLGLFQATGGFDWTDSTNWFQQNVDICDWNGVDCYPEDYLDARRAGHVREIHLPNNHLVGTVPTNVFAIPYLQSLDISGNADVDVDLSGLKEAQFLEHLNLGETGVTNVDNIGDATNLHTLHLTNLGLSGPLPSGLFGMTDLAVLFANFNKFSGSLPAGIGRITGLDELYLYGNDFTGQIPTEIAQLSLLRTLVLSQNAFGGTLPTELETMTDLQILSIAREDENPKGPGISGTVPKLQNHAVLTQLNLENQQLSGNIDPSFLLNAPNGEKVTVDLTNNQLIGTVPGSLASKAYVNLFLADNQFTAVASQVYDVSSNTCSSISSWMDGDVGALGCDAFLCPPGFWAPAGRTTTSDSCATCTDDNEIWGRTSCAGSTPSNVQEREVLVNFYNVMGGRNWKEDENWLSLDVGVCFWFGVDCTAEGKVSSIILRDNGLSSTGGVFPQDIFLLSELRNLNLNSNAIPFSFQGIGAAAKLETLNLAAMGLTSGALADIGQLSELPTLKFLSLASNGLAGNIPSPIYSLSSLEELDISYNKFFGALSANIASLSNLKMLSIAGNNLTGQIPSQLGTLQGLLELSAGENQFGGTLPSQLNALTNLQSLSLQQVIASGGIGGPLLSFREMGQLTSLALDSNKLTGTLPVDFLVGSRFLGSRIEVGLSDNELSGSIPSQWSRFDKLFVDLAGNQISGIHESLCTLSNWMDGDVGDFECDAILCPKGTFNEVGRQSDVVSDCESCDSNNGVLGAKVCGPQGAPGENDENSPVILLELFFIATNGPNWGNNDGWIDSTDYCTFHGVVCDGGGQVTKIDLNGNGLQGTPPGSIFKLPQLRELVLSNNDLTFLFDGISEADSLLTLRLDNTNLASLDGVSDAPNLVSLNVADNVLQGAVSTEVFLLSTLRELDMGYNLFTGKIPNILGALTLLEELRLAHNGFTGRIPAALADLTELRVLNLAENNFEGTIPQELNDLTNLRMLSLQREGGVLGTNDVGINQGKSSALGPGLTGKLPAFDSLPFLTELYLGVNSLSGSVPFKFIDGIVDTSVEIKVDLTSNRLDGTIPASLTQFDALSLYLGGNRITGIADGLCSKSDWIAGDVGRYSCDGILCPVDTYNRLGRKGAGSTTCDPCASGTKGVLGSFECLSSDDHAVNGERAILEKLYSEMRGDLWIDNTNWLDPDESICTWFGIKCVSDDEESVISIDLESNRLHDKLPTEVYSLPNLKELVLEGNAIAIPFEGIGNAPKLEYLDFENCALNSLSGIGAASASLKVLRIGGNSFESIPSEIFDLSNLEVLSMSDNAFPDQPIPNSFQSFSNLVYFSCFSCGFQGSIPTWLGSFANLEYLRLSQNGFTGTLPLELEQLGKIKHLDFSDQQSSGRGLDGPILPFASQTQLTEIYLQHNNFQGNIPITFLQGLTNPPLVTVDLRYNRLEGTIPTELGRLNDLNFYAAANNFIDPVPDVLCNKPWNDGNTGVHGCNAILCEKGTFNAFGRAIGDLGCLPCENPAEPNFVGNTYCGSILEHTTLIFLYRQFGGPSWKSDQNWLQHEDHCTWEGITCHIDGDFTGLVKEIDLEDNNLVGTLPWGQVWFLEGLEYLNLQKNDIAIPFALSANAINLQTLILSETSTSSLEGIEAKSLKSLHITNAKLGGSIPMEFYGLTNLEEVYISHNELTGTVSTSIGDMKELRDLYFFANKLIGPLPTELGFLARIEHLSLGRNKFTGSIPRQLTSLPLLEVLSLEGEEGPEFDGMFGERAGGFTGTLPALDGLPRIRELYLGYNSFTGTIPDSFLQGVTDKSQHLIVDISFNSIDGSIPAGLAAFDDLQFLAAANNIDNIPPEICQQTNWMNGAVADGCDAILCEPGSFNGFGRRINPETPCEPCGYPGSSVNYGSTECGPFNIGFFTDKEILFELFDAAGGKGWFNNAGWEDDTVAFCDWHGITCGAGSLGEQTVTEISLPSNGLNGQIPSVIYHLPELKKIDVRDNKLTMLFGAIHQATSLEQLYLDKTRVSQLDGIGRAASLKTLHIKSANFRSQEIPDDLFDLTGLVDLDLSDSMFGGTLSTRIGNMAGLQRLSLSGNVITGQIPSEMGQLAELKTLELSNNSWFGTLPSTLSGLTSLEAIFLDNLLGTSSGVSGPLHPFSTMPDISEIHLSNNQLTGTIPEDFLASVTDPDSVINVHLDGNHLVGTVSAQLGAFNKLNIELADNLFVAIGDGLCDQSGWLDGDVGQYSCAGLLCPAGTFSSKGRQTSNGDACDTCPGDEGSAYMGVSVCIALEKQKEQEILGKLFEATAGSNWKNRDGWMDSSVDICDWYGISCKPGSTVESILLGSNHLVGTVPTEIYQLSNLKFVWLYSNPIDMSFSGIEQAANLQSLAIDSTRVQSLNGIGRARSLIDIDVRFNRLSGPIPTEIGELVNLESFTCSENDFSGTIPNLTALRRLNTLRMSNNKLTGPVHSFAGNPQLKELDLSGNRLTGPVPNEILQTSNFDQSIFLDLSENLFTGTVPGELSRFTDLTIFLRDNRISGIDPSLCSLELWNGGDVGTYACDGILCPSGTVSPTGRASKTNEATCEPCSENKYFGSTICGASSAVPSSLRAMIPVSLTLLSILGLLLQSAFN